MTALIKSNTLIETAESNEKGKVIFSKDLPCGKYYVKELKPAKGYLSCDEVWNIDASYSGEHGEDIRKFKLEIENVSEPVEEVRKEEPTIVTQIPGTGDSSKTVYWWCGLGVCILAIVVLRCRKMR